MNEILSSKEMARRKMVAFYARYLPDKVASVDAILEQCPGNEEMVIEAMKAKYPSYDFDYLPPDLATILTTGGGGGGGTPMFMGAPTAPPSPPITVQKPQQQQQPAPGFPPGYQQPYQQQRPLSPPRTYLQQQYNNNPQPGYLPQGQGSAAPPPAAPSGAHTRDDLSSAITSLHSRLSQQQRSEMANLESKIQALAQMAVPMQPQAQPQQTQPQVQPQQPQVQVPHPVEKTSDQAAVEALKQQVETLTLALHQKQQPVVARQHNDVGNMRLVNEIRGMSELEKVKRENEILREEGEEGRELIMELHSVIEQLRHSNQAKAGEIETLLGSAQTLKKHYEDSQRELSEQRDRFEREKAMLLQSQQQAQQQATIDAQYKYIQELRSGVGVNGGGNGGGPVHHQPSHPSQAASRPSQMSSSMILGGVSPPRPNLPNPADLVASLQRRTAENMYR